MPQSITKNTDTLVVWRAFSGGWIVSDASGVPVPSELLRNAQAAVNDDEGLIEWFAAQLGFGDQDLQARPPNPGPVADAAGADAPAADGQMNAMVAMPAEDWNELAASLRPLIAFVQQFEGRRDSEAIIGRDDVAVPYSDARFTCQQLRRIAAAFAAVEVPF